MLPSESMLEYGAPEPGDDNDPRLTTAFVALVLAFLGMMAIFYAGWMLSERYSWRFQQFPDVAKADWCARITSTIHASLVCLLAVICIATTDFDSNTLVPKGSTLLIRITFSISIGYFLFDQVIILWWMMPSWFAFSVHHVIAMCPYVITQFFYDCHSGQYVLLLFLLLELSVIPLDIMAFLEDSGYRDTRAHVAVHLVMYLTWLGCRVGLPIYILVVIWGKVVDQLEDELPCLLPIVICGHIFALFTIGVFLFVITPEAYIRMRYGDLMIEENGLENGNYDTPGGFLGFSGPLDSDEVAAPYRDLGSIAESPAASQDDVKFTATDPEAVDDKMQAELLPRS